MRAVARVRSTSMPRSSRAAWPSKLSRDPPASVDTLCQSANIRWRPGMISSARLTECDVCRVGRAARATGSRAAVFSDQVPAHPVIPVPHLVQPSPALHLDVLGPADPCRSGQDQAPVPGPADAPHHAAGRLLDLNATCQAAVPPKEWNARAARSTRSRMLRGERPHGRPWRYAGSS